MKIQQIRQVGKKNVFDISVKDVEHYILDSSGIVTHNSAVSYAPSVALVISKAKERDGTELAGYRFTLTTMLSRYVREGSRFPLHVRYDSGINKYSGMLDLGVEMGFIVKPSNGWYSRVNLSTGEVEDKKWRAKDTNTEEFWDDLLNDKILVQKLYDQFSLDIEGDSNEDIEPEVSEDF